MPEYLSKEEIRQWRSSLEKITLEEFAARLGKVINEEKETRDIVDIVLEKEPVLVHESYKIKTEKINTIAQKAFLREKEITIVKPIHKEPVKEATIKTDEPKEALIKEVVEEKPAKKPTKAKKPSKEKTSKKVAKTESSPVELEVTTDNSDIKVTFKKPLTEREQLVFDHFLVHKNSIVYAKDLAELLDLPRDYVYKYIKNLRNKINEEDALENANNGGYILKV